MRIPISHADGMRRLRADLDNGEWEHRWSRLLDLDELDLGYRVLSRAAEDGQEQR